MAGPSKTIMTTITTPNKIKINAKSIRLPRPPSPVWGFTYSPAFTMLIITYNLCCCHHRGFVRVSSPHLISKWMGWCLVYIHRRVSSRPTRLWTRTKHTKLLHRFDLAFGTVEKLFAHHLRHAAHQPVCHNCDGADNHDIGHPFQVCAALGRISKV